MRCLWRQRRSCSHPPAVSAGKLCKTKSSTHFHTLNFFGGRGWITQAAHLKKPRRGFFPRRTVRRVDAVRIHPPSLREGYYKTETPVPGSDTGVLGGRGWITQAAHLKKPRRGFFPRRTVRRVDAVRIHPPSLREGYYKTETPVPGSDTGVLGGRGWITQAAHLKKPRRGFFPRRTVRRVDAVRIHP